MPKQRPEKGNVLRSTPRKRFRGVLRAVTGVLFKFVARLSLAIFVSGGSNSGRSDSLRPSRGIYIRARLSVGIVVLVLLATAGMLAHPAQTNAATSDTVNFQAKLMTNTGAIAADGNYNVQFNLYSVSSGGSSLWTESWLNNASQGVRVSNGYLTVNLGAHTPFPSNINWSQDLYIGMTIRGTASCAFGSCSPTDSEMTPRLKLTSVPYAFSAGNLSNISGSGFTSTLVFQGATGQNQTIQIPNNPSNATDDLCLLSLGNCAGSGGGITGSGTQNYVARFDTSGSHIGNSFIFDNGTFLGINTATNNGSLVNIQGSSTTASTLFTQAAASATVATSVIKQSAGQTGNLLEFQDSSGNVNGRVNSTGNILTLGRVAASGTVTQGKIILADGTTDNYSLTLQTGTLTADSTVTIPNAGGNDTVCLYTLANCVGSGGGVAGSGTQNYLTKFDTLGGNHIGNASLYDDGSFIGLNTTSNNGLLSIQGSGTGQSSFFVQAAASASAPTVAIKQATSQSGDLIQLINTSGNPLGGFAANGSLYYANSGFTTTLSTASLTANQLVSLPNETGTLCIQGSANCGFELTGGNNFIQNQTASTQTAGFKINGNGTLASLTANTSILTALVDTPSSGGTLALGTTNATGGINLNQNTTISANKIVAFAAGSGSFDMSLSSGTFQTGTGAVSINGAATASAGITLTSGGSLATQKGTDFSTTGTSNDVNFGAASLYRLTGASAQTITGIAGGADGRILTIINASSQTAILRSEDTNSAAANRIVTGTGSDANISAGASITLIYDSGASRWRLTSQATGNNSGVTTVGAISGTSSINGATVTGNTLNLTAADGTNGGVVNNTTQTFAGLKTFQDGITTSDINITAGQATNLGNATGTLTITGNSSSTFVINGSTIDATEFTLLDGKDAALVDINDAVNTAITGTGTLTSGAINWSGAITTTGNIATTGSGTITSAGLLTATGGLTATNINTAAAQSTSLGNATGTFTVTGDSSSTFVVNGVTVDANEFTLLDGKDAALVDVNDAVATAITGTGTLTTGAINWSGNIDTSGNISTTGTGTITSAGIITANGGVLVANTGSLATQKGTDYSTTGTTNDVNFGAASLYRLTGASTQTITGIAGGTDGRILTLINASSQTAILRSEDAASAAANRIVTGTGSDANLSAGASITLIYDSAASRWRLTSQATGNNTGVTTVGAISGTSTAEGGSITGNTLNLSAADGTNGGVVTNTTQTFAGLKTFQAGITSTNINITAGQATVLGNSTGSLTVTGNSSSSFVINGNTIDATEFTLLDGKDAALVDINDAVNTAITGTGTLTSGAINWSGAITTSGNISTTGAGTITSAGLLTATGGLTATNINTTAAQATNLGNSTGAFTVTGNSSSTFVVNGVTVDATEFTYLDGKNAPLVDTNDAVATAITGTGTLTTGAINWSGAITTTGNISTTGTGTITSAGIITANGGVLVANTGAVATQKGTDFATTGSSNDVNFGAAGLYRLTGASTQTITGIAGGTDGRQLTLVNAASQPATISNNSASSAAANRIITGTGADISLAAGGSITLIYDSGANFWRVNGSTATTSAPGVNTVGGISGTSNANGATITGTTLNLAAADGTNGGVVTNTTQTFAGLKTFQAGITSANINTTAGQTTSLGNSTGALTFTGNSSSLFVINGSTIDATEFTLLDGKDAALIDINDAVTTAITGTGTLTTGAINWSGAVTTSGNISTTGTGTITSAGLLTATGGLTAANINTTAGQATNIGNSTGAFTVAGNSSSTFVVNGVTIDATEFTYLDGKDAALVDINDAVATAITGTGTLTTGAINWSGAITTTGNISTTGTGTITSAGIITANGGVLVANTGSVATQKGTDYSTIGSTNDVAFGSAGLYRLTGASAQTITGIAGGTDGRQLTLVNAASQAATISNNSASSAAANRIITGSGSDLTLPAGGSITLIYDSGANFWRVNGSAATTTAPGVNTVGAVSGTSTANGATITGTTLNLAVADATNAGLVSTIAQSYAGLKTFQNGITSANINTTAGQATSLGNATGALTFTGNSSSSFVINGSTIDATEFTLLDGKDAALVDINDAVNTAITGTGSLTSGSIASGFGVISTANNITTSANISTTGTGTITSAGLLTATGGLTATNINTTAGQATNVGNSTGAFTVTGNSSSTFVVNGVTIDATEFGRLDGKDAALVDVNDAVATAITGTGTLTTGSINWSGAITTTGNISTTGTGTITSAGLITASGGLTATNINTTAAQATNLGNTTGTLAITGNSSSTFSINGASIDATEFNRLDGKDAALVDVNDAVATAITGTGTLTTGSINWSGAITTTGNISTTGTGTITSAGLLTANGGLTAANINTTAAQATSLGNSTGTFTLTGNSSSTFVINGVTIDATEFGRLDGKDAALVDVNDAVATAITGTGILTTGSINWSGNIATSGNISTSGTGTITSAGIITANGGVLVASTGSLATQKGTDFSTVGASNDVAFGSASLYRLTGASAQTLTGIAGGTDGRILTIVNAGVNIATLADANTNSAASNRIITGTGADISLPAGASITLIYDSSANVWRVNGSVAYTTSPGVSSVGSISNTSNANGATITGATLNLTAADGTNGGVITNAAQTLAGLKTFQDGLTSTNINTTAGQATNLGNSTGALTVIGNSSSTFVLNGSTIDATEFTRLDGKDAALIDVNDAVATAITGTGTLTTGAINWSGAITTSGNISTTGSGTITSAGLLTASGGLTAANINTTAGQATNIGNSTGALTVTGNSSSTFVVNGVTIDATEFGRLDGKNAALVDVNDAVATAITGTGILTTGSINWSGAITTTGNISTTGTGTITSAGLITASGGLTAANINTTAAQATNLGNTTGTLTITGNSSSTFAINGATIDATEFNRLDGKDAALVDVNDAVATAITGTGILTTGSINWSGAVTTSGNISTTGSGTITSAGLLTANGGLTAANINTTAAQATSLGNATGTFTVTGNSSSTFVINGVTIDATEFGRLDGKDAALVDVNDAVATAITGTGILTTGSINWSGAITTSGNISTTGTGTITSAGIITANGGITVANTGSLSTTAGASFTTPGTSTSAALNTASFYTMNTSGAAQVIQGITAGRDGQRLTLSNINALSVTLANNNAGGTALGKILTGTNGDVSIPTGATVELIYDATASVWRVTSAVAATGGAGVNTVGAISGTSNANGATITGTTLNLTAADGTNGGVITNAAQTLAGLKTFQDGLTSTNINTTAAQATNLGNSTGALTVIGNSSSTFVLNGSTIDATEFTRLDGKDAALVDINDAVSTAITGTGTLTSGSINWSGNVATSGNISTSGTGTITSAGLLTANGGLTAANINTTAGQGTNIGNTTGALTVTGNSSTTFVINGVTVDATEFNRLDGKDAALVDVNDAVSTAITGTGTLTTGAINWSGAITTSGNISTTGTGTITSAGLITASGGLSATNINTTAAQATNLGNSTGILTITGNSSSTFAINGATIDATEFNRLDGKDAALVDVNDAVATAITGTGILTTGSINWSGNIATSGNISTSGSGTITSAGLITASGGLTSANINTTAAQGTTLGNTTGTLAIIGNSSSTFTINGATVDATEFNRLDGKDAALVDVNDAVATAITGTGILTSGSINWSGAIATTGNISTTGTGTITSAGLITASGGLTATNINTTAAQATNLGNSTGTLAITGNSSSTFAINGATIDATEFNRLDGKDAALVDVNDAVATAITGTGTLTTGAINWSGAIATSGNISTSGTGTITSAGLLTANGGLTAANINTTAAQATSLGNATGTFTLTGNSSSSFVINGVTVDATEFGRLDGKDAALVDVNDAVSTAITGTGALTTGSINWSGNITTSGNISTSGTGTITSAGIITANGGITVANTGSLSTTAGASFTTPGTSTSAALNTASFYTMNTSGAAQVIQGITAGRDGQRLTLSNINASAVTLANNNAGGTALGKILTGTNGDVTIPTGATVELIYDATATVWRVTSAVAATGGAGVNTVGAISGTSNANGATITGTTLNLTVADNTNGGVVSNTSQTFAGLKTFQGGITSANINTTAGQATSLGNTTGALTFTGNSSSTFVINGTTIDATEFTYLDGKNAALVDINDAVNTAITGTGALTSGSIATGFGVISTANNITTSANISTTGTGTITSAGLLTATGGLTATNINTTAAQATNIGNSTGAFTVTGNSSSTFVVNGVTVDATEFTYLDGKNAALVDVNDAVATAITGTGTLTTGAINWSGAITTTGNISTTGTGTITSAGLITASGGLTATSINTTAAQATNLGNSTGSLTITGNSSSTFAINGVTVDATEFNRLDGKDAALLDVNDAVSTAITGTGILTTGSINWSGNIATSGNISTSGTGTITSAGIITANGGLTAANINTTAAQGTTLGNTTGALAIVGNSSTTFAINGASVDATEFNRLDGKDAALVDVNDAVATAITGTGILTTGSINWSGNIATSGNISTSGTGTITSAGLITANGGFIGTNINTTAAQTTNLGNSTGTLTITGNSSTTFAINGATVDATEFNRLDGKDAALVDVNDAVATAITGTGTLTTGAINWSGAVTTSGNISTTGSGTITSAGLLTASGGLTATNINTTAAQATNLGNATGAFTVTGNSSSTFVINGVTVDATEFGRLDGKDAALVDVNDAVATAITGTGILTTGSINWSGNIATSGNISTSGTGTITSAGIITANGGITVANTGSLSTAAGASFTTPGTSTSAALNTASYYTMNTSGAAQVIQGITAGRDGQRLTVTNVNASAVTLANNNAGGTALGKIITGTAVDITVPNGASAELIYDATNTVWRVVSAVAGNGSGATTVGAVNSTPTATGGTITGTTLNLSVADATNAGLISTTGQSIGGAKTFSALITGNAGITTTGGAVSLQGNAASSITTTTGALTFDAAAAINLGQTNTTSIAIGRSGITTTVTGGLTQLTGAVSLTANAASSFTTTAGALTFDAAAALNLGQTNATSIAIGRSGITTTITGGLTQLTGAISLTGNATSTISTTTGNFSLDAAATVNIGVTNATNVTVGRTGQTITLNGDTTSNGNIIVAAGKYVTITGSGTRPASPTEGMIYFDTTTKQLLTYANGKWQADRTEAVIVAASNSSQSDKDAADYVADGNTGAANDGDQVQINSALTAGSGKKVILLAGTYIADASISIPNNTTLTGVGKGTVIEFGAINVSDKLIENADQVTGTGVTVRDMYINGRQDLNTSGYLIGVGFEKMGGGSGTSARQSGRIQNVDINDFDAGIELSNSAYANVTDNSLTGNDDIGISLSFATDSVVQGNTSSGDVTGISVVGSDNNTISDNRINSASNRGFYIWSSTNNVVSSNFVTGSTSKGFEITASNTNIITANRVVNSGGATTNNAIYLDGADSNTITSNVITDTSATTNNYAINIFNATADLNYLADNTLGGGSINNAGTGTIFGGQLSGSNVYTIQQSSGIALNGPTTVTGNLTQSGGAVSLQGNAASSVTTTSGNLTLDSAAIVQLGTSSATSVLIGGTANTFNTTVQANLIVGNGNTGSINALQVKNSGGAVALNVDTTNTRVGIGVAAPTRALHVYVNDTSTTTPQLLLEQAGSGDSTIEFKNASNSWFVGNDASDQGAFKVNSSLNTGASTFFGNKSAGDSNDNSDNNFIETGRYSATATGTVTALSVNIGCAVDSSPNNKYRIGLYTDNGSNTLPQTLLASSAEGTLVTGWNTLSIAPTSVVSGTTYWIGYITNGASATLNCFRYTTGTGQNVWKSQAYAALPASFGAQTGNNTNSPLMYATIQSSGSFDTFNTGLLRIDTSGATRFQNYANSTNAFQVQNAAGTTNVLGINTTNNRVGINLNATETATADLSFGTGNRTINILTPTTTATAGGSLTINSGTGNTSGAGGLLTVQAGAGGTSGAGGALSLRSGNAAGGTAGAVTLDNGTSSTGTSQLNIGTANAGAINIGRANITTAITGVASITNTSATATLSLSSNTTPTAAVLVVNATSGTATDKLIALQASGVSKFTVDAAGNVVVGNAAGTGSVTNNGATVNTPVATISLGASGALGTAAATVDAYTYIPVVATAGSLSFTVPTPTASTTYGRIIYITNIGGTNTFGFSNTYLTATLKPGATASLIWSNVNGVGNWTYAGSDAGGIFNQTTQQTSANFNIDGSGTAASFKVTAGTGLFDVASGGALNIGTTAATSIVFGSASSTVNTLQASGTTRVQSTTDNSAAFAVSNSQGANIFSVDDTNSSAGLNAATNGGAEAAATNWTAFGTSTVTRTTTSGEYVSGVAGIKAAVTAANSGTKYNLTLVSGTTYSMSFSVKSSAGTPTFSSTSVYYSTNGTSSAAACTPGAYDSANITTQFVKYTCTFTATSSASAFVVISQSDATSRNLLIDNLSVVPTNAAGGQNTGVIKVGGATSQGLVLFQLDTNAGTPFTGANASLAGAMYFDTIGGKMQCYDGSAWGACGAAPNSNVTLTPEYTGAVLNGTGIGTLTSDFCANQATILVVPATGNICNSGDARNFYKWTSPQSGAQTYSVYVTYKLPSTFKQFVPGTTSLTGRVDNTTNAGVSYSIFKSTGAAVSACGTSTNVVGNGSGSANTWTTASPATDPSTCGFASNNNVIFQINVSSLSNAVTFIENLNFNYSNQ